MRRVLVVLCVLMVLLAAGVATLLANSQSVVDVPLEIAKGLINLFVAVAVTGVLAYLLSQRG